MVLGELPARGQRAQDGVGLFAGPDLRRVEMLHTFGCVCVCVCGKHTPSPSKQRPTCPRVPSPWGDSLPPTLSPPQPSEVTHSRQFSEKLWGLRNIKVRTFSKSEVLHCV